MRSLTRFDLCGVRRPAHAGAGSGDPRTARVRGQETRAQPGQETRAGQETRGCGVRGPAQHGFRCSGGLYGSSEPWRVQLQLGRRLTLPAAVVVSGNETRPDPTPIGERVGQQLREQETLVSAFPGPDGRRHLQIAGQQRLR